MQVTVVYTIDPCGLNAGTVRNIIEGQRGEELHGVGGLTIEVEDVKVIVLLVDDEKEA